ncbi:flavin reductase family protein [Terrarubrum flagellatum]|uniref:flavin reductase family protein n=1 Tax=Terrirubrum flagellatum TaxID=2895980 RepID=UPI003144F788
MTNSSSRSKALAAIGEGEPGGRAGVDSQTFRAAMKTVATPVTVIATGEAGMRYGITASSVCSLSDQPPMILACINRNSAILPYIRANGCFSANFLAEAQSALAERFAGITKVYGPERFDFGSWGRLVTGAPVLEDALSVFDCSLDCEHDSPTHAVLIGRVEAIRQGAISRALVYARGRFSFPEPLAAER